MHHFLRYIILLTIITISFPTQASGYITLSDSAEVSLLTMSPGQEELYTAFGHSAIRLKDPLNRIDILFNYGVFHFNQPNFYLNFTRGKLYYELGVKPYSRSIKYYLRNNRTITEQLFNLTPQEKQQLFELLMTNAEPENKNYYYNYCYNNCATKIRDILGELLGNKLIYDFKYAKDSLSYRDLMDRYLDQQPWGDLAIDFCLGSEIDRIADGADYMYMPEFLMKGFNGATIKDEDSIRSLVKKTHNINEGVPMPNASTPIKPIHISVALFFIIGLFTHRSLKYNIQYKLMDYGIFGITGLLGITLILLWFTTDHLSQYNLNVIWCIPLNLIAVILLATDYTGRMLRYYFMVYAISLIGLILFREMIPQQLHFAFIPLVLGLIIRSFYWVYILGKSINKVK